MKREEEIYTRILSAYISILGISCTQEELFSRVDSAYQIAIKRVDGLSKPTKSNQNRFIKPTVDEVRAYIKEKSYQGVDAEKFINFYESKGWKVGKTPMKSWKAAVANWASSTEKKTTTFSLV